MLQSSMVNVLMFIGHLYIFLLGSH